ncbi:Spore germination protein YndE [Paenibacillus konkukensis]|uniref:Spore germination protein YndE n=1 Tax=Paenibacillus konkukensis TaxID=2020716 RepID=A0ABY4RF18_9BACL|nr:endospore germination permease [Paenibacillus konkukensis]UQZ81032.1 Spore germination protein YndE [Paenibacillus konkukensis]
MTKYLGRVSQLQIYMLFSQYLFTTILGFLLGTLIEKAGFAAWLSLLAGALGGIAFTYFSFRLGLKRPTQFFGHYGHTIIGRWIHYPLAALMIFSFLFSASFVMRELLDFVSDVYLPDTPNWAVASVFGLCVAYAVRSGVETIFRAAQGIFFFSVVGVLFVPLFVGNTMNPDMWIALTNHFKPKGIWSGMYIVMALYGQMNFILFLFPYFAEKHKTMKSMIWAVITSLFIILANLIPTLLIFGTELSANMFFPELELISYVRIGSFLENLDPILISVWLSSLFIKISLFLFVSVIALTHTFALEDHKPFSFSMTATMIALCLLMARSAPELTELLKHGEMTFLILTECIPIIYFLVDAVRFRRLGINEKK